MTLTHKQIKLALQVLRPQGGYSIIGTEIVWDLDQIPISEEDIIAAAQQTNNNYREQRRAEYPSIEDQLDLLFHGGFDAWHTAIETIKNKYPKN